VLTVSGLKRDTARQGAAYNLSIQGIHTYHVGDNEILVHNMCTPGGAPETAGPGAWGTASESMSARAAAYQEQITGGAAGSVYRVNGVKFDGYADGVLQDAKGPGYAWAVKNGRFRDDYDGADGLAAQAQRQLAAAGGTPIEWSVAEADTATAIRNLFIDRGISGINVLHVPYGG
jgi:hypothetical protein